MSKFKKGGRGAAPAVNTSSLPDIVFMLLFFFMVATTSKEVDPTVKVDYTPGQKSRDLTPYKQRSEVDFIYLGKPRNKTRESMGYVLSLDNVLQGAKDDGLYGVNVVGRWKLDKYNAKPPRTKESAPLATIVTCVKADKNAPSGMIFKIRKELQDVQAYSIAYAVKAKD
jgi:biopolymer transport protein ExbD